jgi:DNA-directed RNA polymerase specialized sigma24 family protein
MADIEPAVPEPNVDLLALDEALESLEKHNKRMAELIKLRFFAGLTTARAAEVLGIATSTANEDWAYARCWIRLELGATPGDGQR